MDRFRTNIALIPKPGKTEKTFGLLVVAFMLMPFILGFVLENNWLFLSLPIGVLLLMILNWTSKGKFNSENWIQKDFFIEFDLNGIKIINSTRRQDFAWSAMADAQLLIKSYDGERKEENEGSHLYTGTENTFSFHAGELKYRFNFYLKNAEHKEGLRSFLRNEQLDAPNLQLTLKDQGTSIHADVKTFQNLKKPEKPKATKKEIGCLILFFLPFLVVGLGTLSLAVYQFGKVYQARSWTPVNAIVRPAEFVSSSDSEGTSYTVKMQYEYVWESKAMTGNSVSFNVGMTNVEDYSTLYQKLNSARVVEAYVNGNNPGESVVIRGVTNAMIGMVIFSLMWNSLLMVFLVPIFFKQIKIQKLLGLMMIIWVLGIGKFVSHFGDIDISKQVVVIEAKETVD
jgi:hypothetical protein